MNIVQALDDPHVFRGVIKITRPGAPGEASSRRCSACR